MFISREMYLKKIRTEKRIVTFFRFLIIVIFIGCWEVLARFNVINTFTFSSPSNVIEVIFGLKNNLFLHIGITLYETLLSFALSIFIGLSISTLMWFKPIVSKIIDPYLTVLNSLPKVSLGPLIIIWIGASRNSIIFMSLLISSFIIIINIYNGFISTDKNYITLMKSFGASKWQIFKKVILPSNAFTLISALKVSISMNLIGM